MFLVMVWHGRRRLAAAEERVAALEEVQRVSLENLRLLTQQHRFLQDASHELGTPITVALGHAELIERAVTSTVVAQDARVVTEELMRLRRLATRMLLLASAGGTDFLHLAPVVVESVVVDAFDRWSHTPRRWGLTTETDAAVHGEVVRPATMLFGNGDDRGLDAERVTAFTRGYRAAVPLAGEQLVDAAHRLWWERLCEFRQLKWHYERGDCSWQEPAG